MSRFFEITEPSKWSLVALIKYSSISNDEYSMSQLLGQAKRALEVYSNSTKEEEEDKKNKADYIIKNWMNQKKEAIHWLKSKENTKAHDNEDDKPQDKNKPTQNANMIFNDSSNLSMKKPTFHIDSHPVTSNSLGKRQGSDISENNNRLAKRHGTFTVQVNDSGSQKDDDESTTITKTIWEEWLDVFQNLNPNLTFKYSPSLHNVIRMGYGLQPVKEISYDIYYDTMNHYSETADNTYKHKANLTTGNTSIIYHFIDSSTLEDMRSNMHDIKKEVLKGSTIQSLLYRLMKIIYNIYDSTLVPITHSEAAFNSTIVFPLLKAVGQHFYEQYRTKCYPGEEKLEALFTQLKLTDPTVDARNGYNADSIIRVGVHNNIELMIAEVSSRFSKPDKSKHATDHYKGMFGLLSMCKAIADNYKHASLESFKKQKVFFLQAYNQHVYLWSLFCVDENLFCLFREKKAEIPFLFRNRSLEVLNFMYFVNEIKVEIKEALLNLDILEQEHMDNSRERRYMDADDYITLDKIIKPSIVKISDLKGYKGMAQAEPLSSQESNY